MGCRTVEIGAHHTCCSLLQALFMIARRPIRSCFIATSVARAQSLPTPIFRRHLTIAPAASPIWPRCTAPRLDLPAYAETPEEWITLGARVHGAFGAFIPLGIRIGLDAMDQLHAKPRELTLLYYDSDAAPCACFSDGIAIATYASVGQRTLTIAPEKTPPGAAAIIIIRPRQGGPGFKYTIPTAALAKLASMNKELDPRGRYDAVMAADGLFQVEAAP
jgi:hypothetical protein